MDDCDAVELPDTDDWLLLRLPMDDGRAVDTPTVEVPGNGDAVELLGVEDGDWFVDG